MRHADQLDAASEREQQMLEAALARQRHAHKPSPRTGQCLSCDADVPQQRVYCDANCRADHERVLDAKRRAGR